MVQITLLEVDLADAEFNAPFARASGGELLGDEPSGGLRRVIGQVARSGGGESGGGGEPVEGVDVGAGEAESPGRGMALVGAFFVLVILGWLASRARRRRSADEQVIEAS